MSDREELPIDEDKAEKVVEFVSEHEPVQRSFVKDQLKYDRSTTNVILNELLFRNRLQTKPDWRIETNE